jgi:hypothetical protein
MLHELYCKYDALCELYGVYKVETIGDCYMACTGAARIEGEEGGGNGRRGALVAACGPPGASRRVR